MNRYILFIVLFLFTYVNYSYCTEEIKFKHLSIRDGLSRSWVRCIYQDKHGFLWFGTGDGLNRYDGYNFKVYSHNPERKNSLDHNYINVIYEDKKGNLWVGTQQGMNLYNREHDEFVPLNIIQNYIACIYEFENENFLIGTAGGLYFYNPQKQSINQIINTGYIADIIKDNNNNLWVGTKYGLILLDTSDYSYTMFTHNKQNPKSISENYINLVYQDSKERIWIGTKSNGLSLMKYEKEYPFNPEFINFSHDPNNKKSISQGAVLTIFDDNKGNLWVGTENGGLNITDLNNFDENHLIFEHYKNNPTDNSSISNNSVYSIYQDNQNTVWIGTYDGGLDYYNRLLQKFKHYKYIPNNTQSLSNNHVNVIFDDGNYLWIGTEEGLNIMNGQNDLFHHFVYDPNDEQSISSNAVWSIYKDSHENTWIGTWAGGLNLFNGETKSFTRFLHGENSLGGKNVCAIIEDSDGHLWIASMGDGLYKYNYETNTYKRFLFESNSNSLSNNWINSLLESSFGEIWASTTVAVDVLDRKTEKFITFTHDTSDINSISFNGAITIFEDSKKNIWLGTNGGLNLFNREDSSFIHYQEDDGLPNNSIKGICEDRHGNLWLTTNNGISKFINGVNRPRKPVFKNYDVSDGLQGNEFIRKSICKGKDGRIYVGGTNGFNVFHPDSIRDNSYMPKVVLTNFLIFNKPVELGADESPLKKHINETGEIKLLHKQSVFSIEYAALNFIAPEKNQYAYILEGFEKEWNYVGTKRVATYTNLDPGKYTFRVKGSNNDGLWNEEGVSLKIIVLPPLWQTWWAKAFYVLLIALALYFFRKYTIISVNFKKQLWLEHIEKQKSEELNQLKFQFFTNISHELRTPLTLIIGPLNKLLQNGFAKKELELIKNNVTRLRNLVDQILDFRKIENNRMQLNLKQCDIIDLTKKVFFNFSDFAEQKNINLVFKSKIKKLDVSIDDDKIEKILTNILANALKYTSPEGTVKIKVKVENNNADHTGFLLIKIKDTGKGISKEDIDKIFDRFYTSNGYEDSIIGTGIGLHLTQKLVELHGGKISVKSQLEKGSVFSILLPVNMENATIEEEEIEIENSFPHDNEKYPDYDNDDNPDFIHEKTILIIDDNFEICDYLDSILKDEFNIIKECNSLKGFDLTVKFMPDLIVSDVMMPGVNGFELCKKIKTDIRLSHIPVLLLTAKATTEDNITGFETGADDYIYKPFDEDLLKSRIKNLIKQREQLRKHFIGDDGIVNSAVSANSLDRSFIDKIFSIIQENYKNTDFNVNMIVKNIGMSRSVFYKKFKALSDLSINDLIKNYRLKRAEELLLHNKLTISEIAYDTGFSDPAYFSKVFKEHYKVPPKDFANHANLNKN